MRVPQVRARPTRPGGSGVEGGGGLGWVGRYMGSGPGGGHFLCRGGVPGYMLSDFRALLNAWMFQ